jgi:cytochrome c oxidase subunit 4
MSEQQLPSVLEYTLVWAIVMVLFGANLGISFIDFGRGWNSTVTILIAAIQIALIGIYLMHMRSASGIMRLVSLTGLIWLAILVGLSLVDYATRTTPRYLW